MSIRAWRPRKPRLTAQLLLALCVAAGAASAEERYPSKPVRFVVAFAPGGITDIIARLVGEGLSARIGQTVVIDNKAGAAGALGAKAVANADPDGYSILITTTAVAIGSAASPAAVDPSDQLTPIALLASAPTIFAAKMRSPRIGLMDLVRGKPDGRLTFSSAGAGTTEHLTAAYVFRQVKGLEATHVPYRSGAETVNSVLGDQVDLTISSPPAALEFIKDRKLDVLAVASHKRIAQLPDAPTLAEAGFADVENASWIAAFGPPGLPASMLNLLRSQIGQVLQDAALRQRLQGLGFDLGAREPDFAGYVRQELGKWREVIKVSGVELN